MRREPIEDQVVAIVGAASGIGRVTALRFAGRGARTVVADNDMDGLESLVAEIRGRGGQVCPVLADVAEFSQVQAIADTAVRQYGRLDTWVHVAAVALYARFIDTTPTEFQRVMDVNLLGQVYGAKVALPYLVQTGGGLIHVSSIEAKRAFPFHSAYASSKHAIDGFLEALRVELAHDGVPVSVTQIMPASINTPLFDKALTKLGVKPKGIPPFYEPDTVAEAILRAAERPQRDVVVGGAGKALVLTQRLSPGFLDAVLARIGFVLQRTSEPRGTDAPNNLFGPVNAYNRVEGDFGSQALRHSVATWLDQHPELKTLATVGTAVGLGALLAGHSGSNGANGRILAEARRAR